MAQVALLGTLTTLIQGTQVVDSANEAAVRAGVATATQHLRDVPALGVTATGATVGVANSRIGLRKGLTSANGRCQALCTYHRFTGLRRITDFR
jgi:hypothetical protein